MSNLCLNCKNAMRTSERHISKIIGLDGEIYSESEYDYKNIRCLVRQEDINIDTKILECNKYMEE